MCVNDLARADQVQVLELAWARPEVITVEQDSEVGVRSLPVKPKRGRQRSEECGVTDKLGSDSQFELAGYVSSPPNVLETSHIIVRREFRSCHAGRVDKWRTQFGKLLATFPKRVEV